MQRNDASVIIAGRTVASGQPLFAIAEIGLNHSGSLARALEMVDAAAAAGASAVKLQSLEAAALVAASCPAPAHVEAGSLTEFFAAFELNEAAHHAVAARARQHGLAFISTPFSLDAVDMLQRIGVDAFKIASGDLTWDALIDRAARCGKPLIISTGMASLSEVAHALATARLAGATQIALLHCVSAYPVPHGQENLRAIDTLGRAFDAPVGLSDHGDDTFAVPIAVAYGASIYERHFMLEGDADAIDGPVSSTPGEFAQLILAAARATEMLGCGEKRCMDGEAPNVVPSRRALYSSIPLASGMVLDASMLTALRPGDGIPANALPHLVGARVRRDVPAGSPLRYADIETRQERRSA